MAAIYRLAHGDNLADAIERIVDRGVNVGRWAGISLAGIEIESAYRVILTAPVETYLNYARELQRAGAYRNGYPVR